MGADLIQIHHSLATLIDGTSVVLNLWLLYLILCHSTFHMKFYKNILLLTCVGDLVLSVVVLFAQPYALFHDGQVIFVSNGFFSGRCELLDHIATAVWCASLHTNIIFVVLQFIWRYQLIARDERSGLEPFRKSVLLLLLPWCGAQAAIAVWCFAIGDYAVLRQVGLDVLRDLGSNFDEASPPFPSVFGVTSVKWIIHNLFYATSVSVGYAVIVWCQLKSMAYMNKYGSSSRQSTQRAHRDFNRALIVLALTPLASLAPTTVNVGACALQIELGQVTVFLTVAMTSITLVNPIATMLLVRPYRRAITKMIKGYGNSVGVLSNSEPSNPEHRPSTQRQTY